MNNLVEKAIDSVRTGMKAYCKFLSANDSGETGGHQSGILVSKTASEMLFTEKELADNHIIKKAGRITWQDDFSTNCTFTWYKSKNELRITGFGRGFPFLRAEYTGALFVLVKDSPEDFQGFLFNTDEEIQEFLDSFGLTPAETNRPIELDSFVAETKEKQTISLFIDGLSVDFPSSLEMASTARAIVCEIYASRFMARVDPDAALLKWTETEYKLFKALEHARYGKTITAGFSSVDDFVALANQVLNRRKSRAGKSLEHHLSAIFDENRIEYSPQCITEGNKRPDFLFPSQEAYRDMRYEVGKLCTLAAKTTCKDRWRQILNEANRLRDRNKYLCTMQQGISSTQMAEMEAERVILVVPKPYISAYPKEKRDQIWTVTQFVNYVKELEGIV